MRQASRRLTDLLTAWRDANPEQRARLAASIVSEIQMTDGRISAIRPRSAWVAYFEELLHDGAGDESRTREGRNLERQAAPALGSLRPAQRTVGERLTDA
jgi:hypothetical protein